MVNPAPPNVTGKNASALKLLEHMFGRAHPEIAGRFDIDLLDDTIIDYERKTLAALAHAETAGIHR